MENAEHLGGFQVELYSDGAWRGMARARSFESALLRARGLFRESTVQKARVSTLLPNGRKSFYWLKREPLPAEAVEPEENYDNLWIQLYQLTLVTAVGASVGVLGVIILNLLLLVSDSV